MALTIIIELVWLNHMTSQGLQINRGSFFQTR